MAGQHDGFCLRPVDFLGRLAVLVPRPGINLILYYGVLGARAGRRTEMVHREGGGSAPTESTQVGGDGADGDRGEARDDGRGGRWAALMRRTFGFEVLACPGCGGRLRLIAVIEDAAIIRRILQHLRLPDEIPPHSSGARAARDDSGRGERWSGGLSLT
jgi:hypothetical protein